MEPGTTKSADHGVVLIAEDDPATARMLVEWMAQAGHDVVCASSAAEAMSVASRRDPDVAIVDFRPARLDAASLARQLRRHPALRRMPVVLISPDARRGRPHSFSAEALRARVDAAMRAAA
jgi:two-component system, cell cycle response regulator DivK